ncbi:MAG: MFS transporter, partial [Actinobacteria bacterium]|nr:MFS transporter [Actinomycetota bacterium]
MLLACANLAIANTGGRMTPSAFSGPHRKWWTLAAVSFGLFMIMLDNTVVNVALPSIQRDLGVSLSELEWVVTGYALTFAALMLVGGKLADAYGRRRLFVTGMVVFAVASLGCGLAWSGGALIGARVLQGVGAAMMSPATLSIIAATFPPRQRGTAIGIWAGVSALALAVGPLAGGLLTDHLSWHWIFFINLPVAAVGVLAAFLLIDESSDPTHESLDLPGLATSSLALFSLTFALIEANRYGWSSALIVASFAVAAVALAAFVVLERRRRAPMLDLTLFRSGTFVGANFAVFLIALAMFGVFFFVSLYLQNVLGYSAVEAGATFLPMTILIVVSAPLAGRVADRIGSRWLVTGGMLLMVAHLLLFAQLGAEESFWSILPALLVGGVGMAGVMTPSSAAAMKAVPVEKAGVGSAVLNAHRQVGGAFGIALMGAIVASQADGTRSVPAFLDGLHLALTVSAAIAFGGAVVAATLLRADGSGLEGAQRAER